MNPVLLIDNFDSFTWNIYHYALQAGIDCVFRRSDELTLEEIERMGPSGFIFSPGPGRPSDHPLMLEVLKIYAHRLPILGICLGHQAIGEFFGASLIKSDMPVHGKICRVKHTGHKMFKSIPTQFSVGRYHSLLLNKIDGGEFDVTAFTDKGLPMAIAHRSLPIWGVQFHPESILSEGGLQLFENWSSFVTKKAMF
jgi:anthranilate synthase/aminodeoxychorismate synthase-like glutamine amidotransferase